MPGKDTYTTSLVTIFTLAILLASGPAEAVLLDITGLPGQATIGDILTFSFHIDIGTGERIPVQNITITIDGTPCPYTLNGTLAPSSPPACTPFTLTPTSASPYTYGYGYASDTANSLDQYFGYGYGYIHPGMSYGITWDTKGQSKGPHTINITAQAEGYAYSTKAGITLIAPPSPPSGSYSRNPSTSKTSTTTIQIEQPPMLEIRSIQYPEAMLPETEQPITITIKNTGDAPYDVTVSLDTNDTKTKNIAPGQESTYTFIVTPGAEDIGTRTAELTITSGPATLSRMISFEIQDPSSLTEDKKTRLTFDNENKMLTVQGCLNASTKDLSVTIDDRTDIAFMLDKDNCFYLALSAASLSPGNHTLKISEKGTAIYEQSFTVPNKESGNTPTGNIIGTYLASSGAQAALIIIILSGALVIFIRSRTPKKLTE